MPNETELMRAQAALDVASAVTKAAGEAISRHGNDPQGAICVASGLAMAIKDMGKEIDPQILHTVRQLLAKDD